MIISRNKKLLLSIIIFFLFGCERGYEPKTNSKNVIYENIFHISFPDDIEYVELIVLIPDNYLLRQSIVEEFYSIKPEKIYHDEINRYAHFIIKNKDITSISLKFKMEIYNYDYYDIINVYNKEVPNTEIVAKSEYLTVNKEQFDVLSLTSKSLVGRSEFDTLNNILGYIYNNIDYNIQEFEGDALSCFANKIGDCTEFSDLLNIMCRINNIPSRVVSGIYVKEKSNSNNHAWVEVYFEQLGWIPFDPTAPNLKYPKLRWNLKNAYIYLNKDFSNNKVVYQVSKYNNKPLAWREEKVSSN